MRSTIDSQTGEISERPRRPKDLLEELHCRPCKGIPPMSKPAAEKYLVILPGWTLSDGRIERVYSFDSYLDGLEFANKIGHLAEEEDHHPEILIRWKKVKLVFTTHSIKGLSMNDFIMAAKAEKEYRGTTHVKTCRGDDHRMTPS